MKNVFTRILFTSRLKYVLITSRHNSLFKEFNVKLVCHKLPLYLFLPVKEASQGTCLKTSLISALSLADSTSLSLSLLVSLATGQLLKPFQLLCFLTTKTKYGSHFL